MKFTHSFDAVVCCLLALPISLVTSECSSYILCKCAKQMFTCDPFSPEACGSIYMSPDDPDNKVNVPWMVAKDAYAISSAIFIAAKGGNPFGLIALPFKLVNNGKAGDGNYEVDDAFVDAMKKNVQNYVAQAVSQAEMANLYDGIVGNNDVFKIIALNLDAVQNNKEKENEEYLQTQFLNSIKTQRDSLVRQYPKYASKTPTIDPTTTPAGTTTGPNGWGIYYSIFVNQLLLACQQDIAMTGIDRLAVSVVSQRLLVEYGWKAMKHAEMLIDTYVAQRESDITGPTSQESELKYWEIKDTWAYYQEAEGSAQQTCSWDEANTYEQNLGYDTESCDVQHKESDCTIPWLPDNFFRDHSIHCKEGRRQFVTGAIINNWNTWLIEPAKQWAKLVDLICASYDDEDLQTQCQNQGENNSTTYKNNGGTAIDHINNKEEVIGHLPLFVLGFENTNDCPPESSHVIERYPCIDAYNQLAKTKEGIKFGGGGENFDPQGSCNRPATFNFDDFSIHAGTTRPSGCFLDLASNTVFFNLDIHDESGAGGATLLGDQPICRETLFVLGPKNTNDCPLGSSHVINRHQCQDAFNHLATTIEGITDGVDYDGSWGTDRPSGCFLYLAHNKVQFNKDIHDESGADGDTLTGDQSICYSYYPRKDGYIIQQTCQKNYPGANVIATPVPCEVYGCNKYYKSTEPLASRMIHFSDQCDAGLDGWTCCLDSSWDPPSDSPSQTPSSNPSGSPVASTSIIVSGISAPRGIDTEQQFDAAVQSETESLLEEGSSRHRRIEARSRLLPSGCEYVVATKSGQLLATSSDCTDHFSGTELSGITFCYKFTIILSDASANAETCSTNRAAELVVRALKHLTDGWYENKIGLVKNVAIVQLGNEQQYDVTTNMKKTSKKSKK